MVGRKPIVVSHKVHPSLAVKIVQLFHSLGSMESSPGEEGLAHRGDSCSGFVNLQIKVVTLLASALLPSHSGS